MANDRSATATKSPPSLTFGKTEREDHPWEIQLVKHQERTESPQFRAAKDTANKILKELGTTERPYGPGPYEMHHGGSLWVKTDAGWRMVKRMGSSSGVVDEPCSPILCSSLPDFTPNARSTMKAVN